MCYKTANEVDQNAMDAWMDELEAEYLEEAFISERAAEEAERNFDHYQW